MFTAIGIFVVLGTVIGGYLLEEGNLSVLLQPAELVIIFGAAIGSLLVASSPKVVRLIFKNIGTIFSKGATDKEDYLELLSLLNLIFLKIRKEGLISVEADIESPEKSPMFNKYERVVSNSDVLDFLCDNLKVIITRNMPPYELESLMDLDIAAYYQEASILTSSISKVADALPGLGIVAAVLGVVLTMGKIDQPPAILGHSIGAALVGTFLGVFLSYGIVGPIATNLQHKANEKEVYFQVIKVALVAFVGGAAPQMAVESGRRAIPGKERPSFAELESALRKKG